MAEPGESLIPEDQPEDERVDAAEASALEDPEAEEDDEGVLPFGMSWEFDFTAGRFKQGSTGPLRAYGEDALIQWCLMAMNSTRFAHDVFSEAFGVENMDDLIGSVMTSDIAEEFEARVRDALLVHDRITEVEDFAVTFDPASDTLYVDTFSVVTDEDEQVAVPEAIVNLGATNA